MGRAISITASSWAWAHGRTGAMATVGVVITSAVAAEEPTLLPVETAADVLILPIVETTHPQHALAAVAAPTAAIAIYRQVLVLSSVQFHSTLLLHRLLHRRGTWWKLVPRVGTHRLGCVASQNNLRE